MDAVALKNRFTSKLRHIINSCPQIFNWIRIYIKQQELLSELTYNFPFDYFYIWHPYVTLLNPWHRNFNSFTIQASFDFNFNQKVSRTSDWINFIHVSSPIESPKTLSSLYWHASLIRFDASSTFTWYHTTTLSPPLTFIASSIFTSHSFYI